MTSLINSVLCLIGLAVFVFCVEGPAALISNVLVPAALTFGFMSLLRSPDLFMKPFAIFVGAVLLTWVVYVPFITH